ncbi:MAG: hypothetical protein FVQ81_02540 [Candidatus Glassbacteria bacterium]|nr:hypothetical protein [Candidatus Glassbacteria bacterium]
MMIAIRGTILLAAALMLAAGALHAQKDYRYKLVYVTGKPLDNASLTGQVKELAVTAGNNGLNGLVLDAYFDRITREAPYSYKFLREMVDACRENGVEFIPAMMGMGYNAPMLNNDKHLLEGLPVTDALFIVRGREARVADDPAVALVNGGFEQGSGGSPAGWKVGSDRAKAEIDSNEKYAGKSSLKVTMSAEAEDDFVPVVSQEITVAPWRNYRLTLMIKTEGIESRGDVFPILVQGPDGRRLQYYIPPLQATAGWTEARVAFNSREYTSARISVGAPGGGGGTFWIDNYAIGEEGPVNILRREGTPLVVKGEKSGVVYVEGRDYEPLYDPLMTMLYDHEPPALKLTPGSRIAEGERLRVSYWNNHPIYHGQTPACFSDPGIYDWWRRSVKFLHEYIRPETYYLGVDELRLAGTCETCRARGLSLSEMLGECVKKQVSIIREVNPDAEVLIWSDMFDPHHNADYPDKRRDYYYLNYEVFDNSWEYIPRDLIIVCWYGTRRDLSLEHFSSHGFRTIGSSAGNLDTARGWLKSLDATDNAVGMMYTTWSSNYDILPEFGKLVNRKME